MSLMVRCGVSADEPEPEPGTSGVGEPAAGDAAALPGPDMARAALDAARMAARGRRAVQSKADRATDRTRRRGGLTGSGPDPGDPQPFGALINRLVQDRGWERTVAEAAVMGRWGTLVGADVAAHSQPASLRDGQLVLVAESTAWATQLRLLSAGILATLARELGTGVVTGIRVHGPTAPSWRKGPRHVSGRGPRDTYG